MLLSRIRTTGPVAGLRARTSREIPAGNIFGAAICGNEFFQSFRREKKDEIAAKMLPKVRKDSIYCEWIDAIKGDGPECLGSFDYASQLTEVALLGALAQRFGGVIEWDHEKMASPNRPELNAFIKEPERAGWESDSVRPWAKKSFWNRLFA